LSDRIGQRFIVRLFEPRQMEMASICIDAEWGA
jgi:hypothetical protein